jgi:hypothetical protein
MTRNRAILLVAGLIGGLVLSGRIVLLAQDGGSAVRRGAAPVVRQEPNPESESSPKVREQDAAVARDTSNTLSIQDALLRPYHFPFSRPTPLLQVCAHLKQTLKGAVVLDLAALDRQDVGPEDQVQLELEGVRLKTGLKLLLDQLRLTYRVVAEDNLMIITDREGSEDTTDRVWSELRTLHRDLHTLQDDVEDLRDYLGDDRQGGRVHKPTIIEELPEPDVQKPSTGPDRPGHPQPKPGAEAPGTGTRPAPSRIPLHGPRKKLS